MTFKEKFSDLLEKKSKFTHSTNPKKLSDDDLMDFIDWLENDKMDHNPDNKDQHKKALKDSMAQMKKRGFI